MNMCVIADTATDRERDWLHTTLKASEPFYKVGTIQHATPNRLPVDKDKQKWLNYCTYLILHYMVK